MKKKNRTLLYLILVMVTLLSGCANVASSQQLHIYDDELSQQEMFEEIDLVSKQLLMIHPKLDQSEANEFFIDAEVFQNHVNQIKNQVPEKSTPENFYYLLSQIPALLDDNHCYITTPFIYPNEFINTNLKFKDDRLYVTSTFQGLEKGDEVLAIGGLEISEIIEKTDIYISNSNAYGLKHALNSELKFRGIYKYLQNDDHGKALIFDIKTKSNDKKQVRIRYDDFQQLHNYTEEIKSFNKKEYDPNIKYYEKFDDPNKIAYIRLKTHNVNSESFKAFMKNVYRRTNERLCEKLIIDLRNNGGGKDYTNEHIISGINIPEYTNAFGELEKNSVYNSASQVNTRLFILINGGTSGNAYKLALELQKNNLATIVGNHSNESTYYFYNDGRLKNTHIVLPHSSFKLYVPDSYKVFSYRQKNDQTLEPDIFIQTLNDSFVYKSDPFISIVKDQ